MRRPLLLLCLLLPAAISALDTLPPSPPGYLAMNYRAEWRLKPLAEVLEDIQKAIEKPVVTSPAVQDLLDQRRVALVDDHKVPLRETLEHLEATQELRFTAEPLRLRVESVADVLARRRRPVDLDLAEYGLFTAVRDFPAPELGFPQPSQGGGAGCLGGLMASETREEQVSAAEGVAAWLKRIVDAGRIELHGRTSLQVMATPEEEESLRKALTEALALTIQRSSWRVTWGVAKKGTMVPTGIVPAAEAARLAQALEQRSSEMVHALAGQRVHAGRLQERSYLADIEIVNNQQDPAVQVLRTGRMVDLRPLPGASLALLSYRLSWVDPGNMVEVPINQSTTVEPGKISVAVEKDGNGSKSESVTAATHPGSQVTMQLPALWSWSPRGDVVLPQGMALVLCAEHPLGHAVITLAEAR